MRLLDHAAAAQVIPLSSKREAIALATETLQLHFDRRGIRRQRFVVFIEPDAVLGRNTGFVDGQLDGEAILFQQAPVVRTALVLVVSMLVGSAAPGGDDECRQQDEYSVHGAPTSRRISTIRVWKLAAASVASRSTSISCSCASASSSREKRPAR